MRAPASNEASAPVNLEGGFSVTSGSTLTVPVKFSAGPCPEGSEPLRVTVTCGDAASGAAGEVFAAAGALP